MPPNYRQTHRDLGLYFPCDGDFSYYTGGFHARILVRPGDGQTDNPKHIISWLGSQYLTKRLLIWKQRTALLLVLKIEAHLGTTSKF